MILLAIWALLITMSKMPNQRDLAAALHLNQATISLALRGDPSIPAKTRALVLKTARSMGYHPNSYISSLMAHVRAGRPLQDKGCIGLLVDDASPRTWLEQGAYRKYYEGITRRAEHLGFHTECFFLQAPQMSPARIDRILHARGINGLIITAPWLMTPQPLTMHWERYAAITTGYSWKAPNVDRVANDQYKNTLLAYEQLFQRGYRRIGFCLPPRHAEATLSRWLGGYAQCEQQFQGGPQIPTFFGTPADTAVAVFRDWLRRWKPEAIITLIGHEMDWFRELKLRIPEQIAMACVVRPIHSEYSGVEESNETIGEITVDLVSSQIFRNEFGLPAKPKLVLVEGHWVEGRTVATQKSVKVR